MLFPFSFLKTSGGPSSARRGNDSPPHGGNNNKNDSNGLNLPFDELPAVGAAAMSYGQYNQESKSGMLFLMCTFIYSNVDLDVCTVTYTAVTPSTSFVLTMFSYIYLLNRQ